jgi:hypothetical protein
MAKTVNTGWRNVTPGKCDFCGSDDDWDVDGRCNVYCSCQTCGECGMFDGHEIGCTAGDEEAEEEEAAARPLIHLSDAQMSRLMARGCFDSVVIHEGQLYVSCDGELIYHWDGELWIDLAEPIKA